MTTHNASLPDSADAQSLEGGAGEKHDWVMLAGSSVPRCRKCGISSEQDERTGCPQARRANPQMIDAPYYYGRNSPRLAAAKPSIANAESAQEWTVEEYRYAPGCWREAWDVKEGDKLITRLRFSEFPTTEQEVAYQQASAICRAHNATLRNSGAGTKALEEIADEIEKVFKAAPCDWFIDSHRRASCAITNRVEELRALKQVAGEKL